MKTALIHSLAVGAGGFLGALARYGMAGLVQRVSGEASFPYGTLVVNLIGCLLIGVLAGLAADRGMFTAEVRLFVLVGLLGGFTTFSTFGYESFVLLREGHWVQASTNVGVQVIGGVLLVWAGWALASFTPR